MPLSPSTGAMVHIPQDKWSLILPDWARDPCDSDGWDDIEEIECNLDHHGSDNIENIEYEIDLHSRGPKPTKRRRKMHLRSGSGDLNLGSAPCVEDIFGENWREEYWGQANPESHWEGEYYGRGKPRPSRSSNAGQPCSSEIGVPSSRRCRSPDRGYMCESDYTSQTKFAGSNGLPRGEPNPFAPRPHPKHAGTQDAHPNSRRDKDVYGDNSPLRHSQARARCPPSSGYRHVRGHTPAPSSSRPRSRRDREPYIESPRTSPPRSRRDREPYVESPRTSAPRSRHDREPYVESPRTSPPRSLQYTPHSQYAPPLPISQSSQYVHPLSRHAQPPAPLDPEYILHRTWLWRPNATHTIYSGKSAYHMNSTDGPEWLPVMPPTMAATGLPASPTPMHLIKCGMLQTSAYCLWETGSLPVGWKLKWVPWEGVQMGDEMWRLIFVPEQERGYYG